MYLYTHGEVCLNGNDPYLLAKWELTSPHPHKNTTDHVLGASTSSQNKQHLPKAQKKIKKKKIKRFLCT